MSVRICALAAGLAASIAARAWAKEGTGAWLGLTLGPPHRLASPRARLAKAWRDAADRAAGQPQTATVSGAIQRALTLTAAGLRFDLGHRTSLRFASTRPRGGNCVEYAHLFGSLFDRIARRRGLRARAHVVRSHDPRLYGVRIPLRAFRDHDWVVVVGARPRRRWFVDPSFFDVGLGWNIRSRVRGHVGPP